MNIISCQPICPTEALQPMLHRDTGRYETASYSTHSVWADDTGSIVIYLVPLQCNCLKKYTSYLNGLPFASIKSTIFSVNWHVFFKTLSANRLQSSSTRCCWLNWNSMFVYVTHIHWRLVSQATSWSLPGLAVAITRDVIFLQHVLLTLWCGLKCSSVLVLKVVCNVMRWNLYFSWIQYKMRSLNHCITVISQELVIKFWTTTS